MRDNTCKLVVFWISVAFLIPVLAVPFGMIFNYSPTIAQWRGVVICFAIWWLLAGVVVKWNRENQGEK